MSLTANIVPGAPLNDREVQVLQCIAGGMTARQVGTRLGLTENTVRTYTLRIRVKLRARSSAHAVAIGYVGGHLKMPRQEVASC